MEAEQYEVMADLQDHHWWFEAKRISAQAVLDRYLGDSARSALSSCRILEVGCGTGAMVPALRRWGEVFGIDAYLPALAHVEGARCSAGDLLYLPFADAVFDLIGSFDVLYHRNVPEVDGALRELHRVCRPGGHLLITDSAFPLLRSAHDVAQHGIRRFRRKELVTLLRKTGFETLHSSYFHSALFPLAASVRLLQRLRFGTPRPNEARRSSVSGSSVDDFSVPPKSHLKPVPEWLNSLLIYLYRLESNLAARATLPFGLSLLVLSRRPLNPLAKENHELE